MRKQSKTSWETSANWYDQIVEKKGHYYHQKVIFPKLFKKINWKQIANPKVLDLGCGQGILSRQLPKNIPYLGLDISTSLIQAAQAHSKNPLHQFFVQDLTKKMDLIEKNFTHAMMILSLQNIADPLEVLRQVYSYLTIEGKLFVVINHPCFRIPRQTHWGIDREKKIQYRRIDSYLSSQKIPIQTHPSKGNAKQTLSFHYSLSQISLFLKNAGFCILEMEEWISDKISTGSKARMENRSRREFPLFLAFICQKIMYK